MNYYYIVAGLPNIAISDEKVPLSPEAIKEEILDVVAPKDRAMLELYLLRHDNANLLRLLKNKTDWEPGGLYTTEQLQAGIQAIKTLGADAEWDNLPMYMKTFLLDHITDEQQENLSDEDAMLLASLYPESRLSNLYYAEAMQCANAGARQWFEFCLNVGNLLTAANCRRLGLDAKPYIIGNNPVAQALRTNNTRDWGLGSEIDYLDDIMRIVSETDALTKERQLDNLRWNWIEQATVFSYFGVERLLAYLIQTDIIARWQHIDADKGEMKLRNIIASLKSNIKTRNIEK